MIYDIFVSYSTKDKLFVDALVNKLESVGIRCWYAPRDIPPGLTWPAAITQAIKNTALMLLVFSGHTNTSQEVSKELTLASSNKCLVIPVRIENVLPNEEMEYHLSNRHWLDVYGLEAEKAIASVLATLQRHESLLSREVPGTENPEYTPAPIGFTQRPPTVSFSPALFLATVRQWLRNQPATVQKYAALAVIVCAALWAGAFFFGAQGQEGAQTPSAASSTPPKGLSSLKNLISQAEQGDLLAQYTLAEHYLTKANAPEKALPWLGKAAAQGNADAMMHLGDMHYSGLGVKQNLPEAARWYRKAAEKNVPEAQTSVAGMYQQGSGVEKSVEQAFFWYEKAAMQGEVSACYALGEMYENGEGRAQSYLSAIKWYRLAAEAGYATAQYKLGFMYYSGVGVKKNTQEAVRWLGSAAGQGDQLAQEFLEQIRQ